MEMSIIFRLSILLNAIFVSDILFRFETKSRFLI